MHVSHGLLHMVDAEPYRDHGRCAMKQVIAVNECGRRVGDSHHNSKLTDHEVEVIRELRSEGMAYKVLAEKFEVSKSFIAMICRFERRAQVPTRWKTVQA